MVPELEETYLQINAHLLALDECKLHQVYPKHYNVVLSKTVFRFAIYNQTVLHRILDLCKEIIHSWDVGNIGSAFTLFRAVYENISVIYDANKRLEKQIENKDFNSVYKLIFNLQYGTRDKDSIEEFIKTEMKVGNADINLAKDEEELRKVITAQQILDVMDRISTEIPFHRSIYEKLCEYAHPNYDGLVGLYGKWEDELTLKLSNQNGINERNISNFFPQFERLLKMFVEGYDGIVRKLNAITDLTNEDLKKKGRSTEIYKHPIK